MRPALKSVESELREPPYPEDMRAKGFTLRIDWERIKQSSTWIKCPVELRPWLLMVWTVSWTNSPAGTWDDDDELISAAIGMDPRLFMANRDRLMRGWYRASDGRLYHDFIATLVLEMAEHRQKDRAKVAAWRERQKAKERNGYSPGRNGESDTGTGTGTGTGVKKLRPTDGVPPPAAPDGGATPAGKGQTTPYKPPACPNAEIVDLYHRALPELQRVDVLNDARKAAITARWREVCCADKLDRAAALEWFAWLFERVKTSPFLMGKVNARNGRPFRLTFQWLMTPEKFARVVEGFYHDGEKR
jgi:hypothetical protein